MTNETAILLLEAYKSNLTSSCSNQLDGDIEAFDMAIKSLKNERPKDGWVPVSKKMPDVSQRYLVYTKYDEVMTDFFMGDEFMQGKDIIAWQELPKPYKEDSAE